MGLYALRSNLPIPAQMTKVAVNEFDVQKALHLGDKLDEFVHMGG